MSIDSLYGVYLNLPEDDHHRAPALGSTNLKQALASGPDLWHGCWLNPNRQERKSSQQQEVGRAFHKCILEGKQSFLARYVRRPDGLARLDAKTKEKYCPNGEVMLDGEDFDRIQEAAALIAKHPDLGEGFSGGMPEVTVIWPHTMDDGFVVPCKARFDWLKPRGVADLKSIRNYMGRPFGEACARAIVEYRYDMQAAHYLEGRAAIADLVADGLVFGDHDPVWLRRVVECQQFAFQWVFFQAEGAPITWSRSLSPGNPILDIAERDRQKAFATYREFTRSFSDGEMWLLREPVTELEINDLPRWFQ